VHGKRNDWGKNRLGLGVDNEASHVQLVKVLQVTSLGNSGKNISIKIETCGCLDRGDRTNNGS